MYDSINEERRDGLYDYLYHSYFSLDSTDAAKLGKLAQLIKETITKLVIEVRDEL